MSPSLFSSLQNRLSSGHIATYIGFYFATLLIAQYLILRYVWARTSSFCNLLSKRVKGLVKMSRSRRQRGEGGRRQSVFLYHLVSLLRSVPPPPLPLRGNLLHSFFPSFLPMLMPHSSILPLVLPSFSHHKQSLSLHCTFRGLPYTTSALEGGGKGVTKKQTK